jgi:hypothetical protein
MAGAPSVVTDKVYEWNIHFQKANIKAMNYMLNSSLPMQRYCAQHLLRNIAIVEDKKTKLHGLQSASELYLPSDRRLSAKLVPTFADRGCRVVSATDPPGR